MNSPGRDQGWVRQLNQQQCRKGGPGNDENPRSTLDVDLYLSGDRVRNLESGTMRVSSKANMSGSDM